MRILGHRSELFCVRQLFVRTLQTTSPKRLVSHLPKSTNRHPAGEQDGSITQCATDAGRDMRGLDGIAQDAFGILAGAYGFDRVPQDTAEHDHPFVRGHQMLQAMERDRPLAFDGFFVIGVTGARVSGELACQTCLSLLTFELRLRANRTKMFKL